MQSNYWGYIPHLPRESLPLISYLFYEEAVYSTIIFIRIFTSNIVVLMYEFSYSRFDLV